MPKMTHCCILDKHALTYPFKGVISKHHFTKQGGGELREPIGDRKGKRRLLLIRGIALEVKQVGVRRGHSIALVVTLYSPRCLMRTQHGTLTTKIFYKCKNFDIGSQTMSYSNQPQVGLCYQAEGVATSHPKKKVGCR
jgi:hypothetical protein